MNGKCIVCGRELPKRSLLEFDNMPRGAQYLLNSCEIDDDYGIDLKIKECDCCGLIQVDCEPVDYYKDVIRAVGVSTFITELRKDELKKFIKRYNLDGKKIIEIGCGRGEYLSIISSFNVNAYGIENNEVFCSEAKAKKLNVYNDFPDQINNYFEGGPFDAFACYNFLEHQPDPITFLSCIANNLSDEGVGIISVPRFEYIIERDRFYEVIRDHIANYTVETFENVLNLSGFVVDEMNVVNNDTLLAFVKKREKHSFTTMNKKYKKLKNSICKELEICKEYELKVAVWGASHQSFSIIQMMGLEKDIEFIIDSADFKQNKYSPASHLKIVAPDETTISSLGAIIIIAPSYSDEISKIIHEMNSSIRIYTIKNDEMELIL